MTENLVIVESPAKAKTIGKFLGKDFTVMSSYGHIRDLEKKGLGIDVENSFAPLYEISSDKKKLVAELRKAVKETKTVWLASDEDREGEAIAWHLAEVLKLPVKTTKRIVFHEITKDAIVESLKSPRTINLKLVDAQQARRVLDRLVGFELSPILWKKVKPQLSAGRVQSVAVRIIVEREREINAFKTESSYRVVADFVSEEGGKKYKFTAELNKRFTSKKDAESFLEKAKTASFSVSSCEKKPSVKHPAPPFTTSTLQQEASRKFSFPVAKTMQIAQQLYESGRITYMRTDSVNLSALAIGTAKKYITENFGANYSKVRKYETKSKGAQEAHEAIRPTFIDTEVVSSNADEQRLYDLIRKRTLASQMVDAQIESTILNITSPDLKNVAFVAKGETITFDGFLKKVRNSPLDTGIFGTELTVKLLFERGYFDDAIEFLTREKYPSFGFLMNSGATTLWEEWQNPRSMSHPMFGAPVKYLFYNILGIRRSDDSAGFGKVIIEPKTNSTTGNISGYITTPHGKISVSVDRLKNICSVSIPKQIDAKVIFDGKLEVERT